jgi:hypothetical protein
MLYIPYIHHMQYKYENNQIENGIFNWFIVIEYYVHDDDVDDDNNI